MKRSQLEESLAEMEKHIGIVEAMTDGELMVRFDPDYSDAVREDKLAALKKIRAKLIKNGRRDIEKGRELLK